MTERQAITSLNGKSCQNCGAELRGRARLYCGDYCGRVHRADLALDARLSSRPTA